MIVVVVVVVVVLEEEDDDDGGVDSPGGIVSKFISGKLCKLGLHET